MTARLRQMSEYEWATLCALRANAWRWLSVDELCRAARAHFPVRRRVVRHHLARFVALSLVESDAKPGQLTGQRYRWNANPPPDAVAQLLASADAEGFALAPVASPPTHCAAGHAYANHGHRWPEGDFNCFECGEVTRCDDGTVAVRIRR